MTTPTRLRHPTILYEEHSDTRSKAQKEKDLFLPGKEVEVFYDPANPQSSVLIKGIGLSWLAIGLGGIAFTLGLVVLIKTAKAESRRTVSRFGIPVRPMVSHFNRLRTWVTRALLTPKNRAKSARVLTSPESSSDW